MALGMAIGSTENEGKAVALVAQYQDDIVKIRANTSLSAEGREIALAAAYVRTRDAVAQLEEDEGRTTLARRTALERELFGITGTADASAAISYRDAQDRVANVERGEDASRLLTQAERSGDVHLAKAVVLRAFEERWPDVLSTYIAAHPETDAKMQELLDLHPGTARRLGAGFAYVVVAPRELERLSGPAIDARAQGKPAEQTWQQGW